MVRYRERGDDRYGDDRNYLRPGDDVPAYHHGYLLDDPGDREPLRGERAGHRREFPGDLRDFGRNDVPGGAGWGRRDFAIDRAFDDVERVRPSYRGRGPKNFRRSDERLQELVSERLADHEAVDASDMEVTVSNAEVTLTGTVDSRRTKRLAEDVALITPGVVDVHNRLTIDSGFFSRMADAVRGAGQND